MSGLSVKEPRFITFRLSRCQTEDFSEPEDKEPHRVFV